VCEYAIIVEELVDVGMVWIILITICSLLKIFLTFGCEPFIFAHKITHIKNKNAYSGLFTFAITCNVSHCT
jgi:hypothetical protein